jgi:hypothetical protein
VRREEQRSLHERQALALLRGEVLWVQPVCRTVEMARGHGHVVGTVTGMTGEQRADVHGLLRRSPCELHGDSTPRRC